MTSPWLFKPMFRDMGQTARRHPEELIFGLLASGFATNCHDGCLFLDTDHPVTDATGAVTQVSNFQGGAHTFTQIRDDIAASFPPDRRTSLSGLSRWWLRQRRMARSAATT